MNSQRIGEAFAIEYTRLVYRVNFISSSDYYRGIEKYSS